MFLMLLLTLYYFTFEHVIYVICGFTLGLCKGCSKTPVGHWKPHGLGPHQASGELDAGCALSALSGAGAQGGRAPPRQACCSPPPRPLGPMPPIICVTATYTQGWPKHQDLILRNRRKRKMGNTLPILIKVQSSTFVSCLIFKMSLEDTSAQHQSAFSVTFLF